MPSGHNRLIEAVSGVQPKVVVVLMNGSAITMPWADRVKAIVEGWLCGQAGGGAIADVITGVINPSGKLSETFPRSIHDTPTFPHFPAQTGRPIMVRAFSSATAITTQKILSRFSPSALG